MVWFSSTWCWQSSLALCREILQGFAVGIKCHQGTNNECGLRTRCCEVIFAVEPVSPQGAVRLQGLMCVFAPSKLSWCVCLAPRLISISLDSSSPLSSDLAVSIVLVVTAIPGLDEAVAQTCRECRPQLVLLRGLREGKLIQSPAG